MTFRTSISSSHVAVWAFLLVVGASTVALAASLLETIDQEVTSIYDQSRDAVVKIHAERQLQIDILPMVPAHRIGTGFFIDKDGHILTAATVVGDADMCWIEWRGQKINARIIGRDPQTNLALLKIEPETGTTTPFLPQGDSDQLRVGSMVIAIGFPYDRPSVPVMGFVGGVEIQRGGHVFATSHIRAACRLSPGQGGGPLLNVHGEVVGMAVAAHMDDECCALPINAARKISADILEFGQAQHPWVGLGVSERQLAINPTQSNQWQVFIQQIYSNTPASSVGFRDGDIFVSISSNEVHRLADILNTMFYHRVGDKVEFTMLRNGGQEKFLLVVVARPAQEPFGSTPVPQIGPSQQNQWPTMVPASQDQYGR
jgi:S1-C subfamily serine protease